jgi:hypothetical protein
MLIKDVYSDFLSIYPSQLSVLLHVSSLHVFPFILLRIGVKLITQKLQVCLLFLFDLYTNSHIALSMTQRFEFLINDGRIGDIVHWEGHTALRSSSFADDGHLSGCKLADSSGRDGASVSFLPWLDRRKLLNAHYYNLFGLNYKQISSKWNPKML